MKKIIFLFSTLLFAQSPPTCQITTFNPTTIGITFAPINIDSEHCYFWLNSPTAPQVQIACYASNKIIYNSIQTPSKGISGTFVFPDGSMSWIISPGTFQLAGAGVDGITVTKSGTF